jgi:hypothetical protein
MGTAPFVLRNDTRFIRAQNTADPHREIGKSLPMFAIALGRLLRPHERLSNTHHVVKAVRCHAGEQRLHVMLALSSNMLAQNGHPAFRNLHR